MQRRAKGPFCVYVYRDPRRDNQPIYVGKGSLRTARHRQHLYRSTNIHLARKIARMVDAGFEPVIEIVATFDFEPEAFAEERRLIHEIGRSDLGLGPLCNVTDGGEGASGAVRSLNERERLRVQWAQVGARVNDARDRSWHDPVSRQRRIDAIKAAHGRPDVAAKVRASRRRQGADEGFRQKVSAGLKLVLQTPAAKAARSAEASRRWSDPAFKKKTRAAIAAAHNRWWIIAGDLKFGSAKEAAEHLGVTADCITMRCRKGIYQRIPK